MRDQTKGLGSCPTTVASGRRVALKASLGLAVMLAAPVPARALGLPKAVARELSFHNLHTGERLKAEYWHNGKYAPDALRAINVLLRDHWNNKIHPIDPALLDLVHSLRGRTHSTAPVEVVCGYRSPETNAWMHEASAGVAVHSLHIEGRAIDLRLPGTRLAAVRKTALAMELGGVGYYPSDDFVHVDTGPVRHWIG